MSYYLSCSVYIYTRVPGNLSVTVPATIKFFFCTADMEDIQPSSSLFALAQSPMMVFARALWMQLSASTAGSGFW